MSQQQPTWTPLTLRGSPPYRELRTLLFSGIGVACIVKAPSQRDLLGILEFLHGASSVSGPHTFGAYVTSELPRLIPATLTAYAELDLAKRLVRWDDGSA